MRKVLSFICVMLLAAGSACGAQPPFSELVGNQPVQPVQDNGQINCPFMSWGGDVPLLMANGSPGQCSVERTLPGGIYANLGLSVAFHHQDDFPSQVRDYLGGRTPFLRCTLSMLGPASEVLGADPRTKPVVVAFVSWSNGDHLIARANIHNLNDLRNLGHKPRIAVQQGGAHVGWLYELLNTVQLTKDDIEIVWCKEMVSGHHESPPELFRSDPSIDCAFAVTPDMVGLTGGVDKVGTNAEGMVLGAHVLVSTQQMTHAIPDIIACRSDYFGTHREAVQKFVAGYVAASEKLVQMRKGYDDTKKMTPVYMNVLQTMQVVFGKDMIPDPVNDGHGFLEDCNFGCMQGQPAFFADNLSGFNAQVKSALDMSQAWGFVKARRGFDRPLWGWEEVAAFAGVKFVAPDLSRQKINAEATQIFTDDDLDSRTLFKFSIHFEPNQTDFSVDQYGADFERAMKAASQFGGCAIVVRGHSDPTQTILAFLKAGMVKGVIARTGSPGSYVYTVGGKPLDVTRTQEVVGLINAGSFDGADPSPKDTLQAAANLSLQRAQAVKVAIVKMGQQQGVPIDVSQIQPSGAGILKPVVAKPVNMEQARQNMVVDIDIVRLNPESLKSSDFSY